MLTDARATQSHFDAYWMRVQELLKRDPSQTTTAVKLAKGGPFAVDGKVLVRELMQAMDGPQWNDPRVPSDSNWAWRSKHLPADGRRPKEVYLERLIVKEGGLKHWTFQMPTSSGLLSARSDKRRSIDLVYRRPDDHYTFIELKGDANNPLYAAFEVLGYAIAYLLTRKHSSRDIGGRHHVLSARRVDLMVLGPAHWYRHWGSTIDEASCALRPLAEAIETGLAAVLADRSALQPEQMNFSFRRYEHECGTAEAASEIVTMLAGHTPSPEHRAETP